MRPGVGLLIAVGACGSAPQTTTLYAGGGSAIDVFQLDVASGALTFQGMAAAGDQAYLLELDPVHRRAYVETQIGVPVAIRAFDLGAGGRLAPAGDFPLPHPLVEGVTQIRLHPTAPWLLVSATGGASGLQDQLYPVEGGRLAGPAKVIATDYYGFTWDRSGRYFFGLDGVSIGQFVFDPVAGTLRPNDPPVAEGSEDHPFLWLVPHPAGHLYLSVEEGKIGGFAYDPERGRLASRGYLAQPGEPAAWTSLAVGPDGRFLYALGYTRGSQRAFVDELALDGMVPVFVRRESTTLRLDSLQAPLVTGDLLVIGGRLDERPVLLVYRIDPSDGRLGRLGPAGAPVPLQPAATAAVNFIEGLP